MKRWAKVTFHVEGIHCWPDPLTEVSFLALPHRHVFHFTVWIEQFHSERDVEYILFKRWLQGLYRDQVPYPFTSRSCEEIAEELLLMINQRYPDRALKVEVTEDGENGALLESVE